MAVEQRNILETLETADQRQITVLLSEAHPADIAEALQPLDEDLRQSLFEQLPPQSLSEILPYFEETVREQLVQSTDNELLAEAVQTLETDDAVELLDDLDQTGQQEVLESLPQNERLLLQESLGYKEDSAGRLMQRDVLAVPEHWAIGEAIYYFRNNTDLPEHFYSLYLIDMRHRVTGVMPLSLLLRRPRDTKLRDIATTDVKTLSVNTDEDEVAYNFRKYGFVSMPVLDENKRLVGVIMVDDVIDLINEEAEEDILRLAGVGEQSDFYRGSFRMVRSRASWLAVNLLTAILASMVITRFEATIQQVVALAALLPIVASMGGNAGMQTLTVMIRAIAMRQVDKRNVLRVIGQEVTAGLINGALFAVATGLVAYIWFDSLNIGLIVAAAMVINLLIASLAGALIPLGLKKIGADPAIAAGVFLTTVTDIIGFFAVLGLAALFLL